MSLSVELAKHAQALTEIIESSNALLVFVLDAQAKIVDANQAARSLLFPGNDIRGLDFMHLVVQNQRSDLVQECQPDQVVQRDYTFMLPDRTQLQLACSIARSDQGFLVVVNNPTQGQSPIWEGMTKLNQEVNDANRKLNRKIRQLEQAKERIRVLDGLLPICSACKKIRDDKGYWNQLEVYISDHTDTSFSHGICPDCAIELYGKYLQGDKHDKV